MASKYWIKLYHEILDDPKMGRLPDHLWRRTIEVFLLAGEADLLGFLPPVEDMAWKLRTSPETLEAELVEISKLNNIIQKTNEGWFVTHFADRQDADRHAERQAKYRERHANDKSVTNDVTSDVTLSHTDIDIDKDTDKDKDKDLTTTPAPEPLAGELGKYQGYFLTHSKLPLAGDASVKSLKAYQRMKDIQATEEDIEKSIAINLEKYGTTGVLGPWSILNTLPGVIAERLRGPAVVMGPRSNGKPHETDEEMVRRKLEEKRNGHR